MALRPKPPQRRRRYIDLPESAWERVDFLIGIMGLHDHHDVVERAVKMLDRGVCANLLENADLRIHHRDGTCEALLP